MSNGPLVIDSPGLLTALPLSGKNSFSDPGGGREVAELHQLQTVKPRQRHCSMAWSSMDKNDGRGNMGFSVLHAMASKGDVDGVS